MATAEQLKALVKSYAEGDQAQFLAVAMQVAAHAARQGHGKLAQELRALVDEAKAKRDEVPRRPDGPTPLVQPRGELSGLLSVSYPSTRLPEMVLEGQVRQRLERVLREQRQSSKLREYGLRARHRILLVGPPGSGKTMTAAALAGEMHLPLFTIVLDALITKFMGETAAKLRLVFDAIQATRGVYLFDEFDAIGGQRGAGNDTGEIRRVLNSYLQFLEQDDSNSLIIAATNHPELLDHALFRRFDDVLEYSVPSRDLVARTIRAKISAFVDSELDWTAIAESAEGLSYAELTRACGDAIKESILDEKAAISTPALLRAFEERRASRRS